MTLVDDNDIKKLRRVLGIVDYFLGSLLIHGGIFIEGLALSGFVQFLTPEDRIHPLNCTDAHVHIFRNKRGFQSPNIIQLGERTVIIIGPISQEFTLCLFAQAFGIHQEQHPVHTGMLQQTINGGNGRKSLACASCHLDQCLGLVGCEGLLQIADSSNLTLTESSSIKIRELLHSVPNGVWLFHQPLQFLGLMECKDAPRTIFDIVIIRETGQLTSGFVGKANSIYSLHPLEGTIYIAVGLTFHGSDILTGIVFFGLNDADRGAIYEQRIIYWACASGEFTYCNTQPRKEIELLHVLDNPTGLLQFFINHFSGLLLRCHTASPSDRYTSKHIIGKDSENSNKIYVPIGFTV